MHRIYVPKPQFFLLRHGECEHDRLTDVGKREIENAARQLRYCVSGGHVFSSPARRVQESSDIARRHIIAEWCVDGRLSSGNFHEHALHQEFALIALERMRRCGRPVILLLGHDENRLTLGQLVMVAFGDKRLLPRMIDTGGIIAYRNPKKGYEIW